MLADSIELICVSSVVICSSVLSSVVSCCFLRLSAALAPVTPCQLCSFAHIGFRHTILICRRLLPRDCVLFVYLAL